MRTSRSAITFISVALAIAAAVACSDTATAPEENPLAGLAVATRVDSAPSQSPDSLGPGHFVGTLYGYEPDRDSAASAVRIEGARVTAYIREEANDRVVAGDQVASVLTDAHGDFHLPTLPSDQYVVTFVPPAESPYRGGWTTAQAWQHSGDYPWYIMLPRK